MDEHYLSTYLKDHLPALGLDYETYGAYIIGLVDDEDNDGDWDSIVELLAASSDSHSDETDAVWSDLKNDIMQQQRIHTAKEVAEKEQALQQKALHEKERLGKEIELAQQAPSTDCKKKPALTDAQRAIVDKYAYDESEVYDKDGNLVPDKANSETVVTNKDVAAQLNMEKAKELRKQNTSSKKDAQMETKQAKLDKLKIKEDRRKRAVKGERKK